MAEGKTVIKPSRANVSAINLLVVEIIWTKKFWLQQRKFVPTFIIFPNSTDLVQLCDSFIIQKLWTPGEDVAVTTKSPLFDKMHGQQAIDSLIQETLSSCVWWLNLWRRLTVNGIATDYHMHARL